MTRKYANIGERILAQISAKPAPDHCKHLGPCWLWQGYTGVKGYGRLSARVAGKPICFLAHRVAYIVFAKKRIPDGMTLDHLCYRNNCCNPAHLDPVSRSENTRRQNARSEMTERMISESLGVSIESVVS